MFEEVISVNSLPLDIEEDAMYEINQSNINNYTHGMFKYPCKFIPEIPRWAITKYLSEDKKNSLILDPFAGSGTTLLEASILGINSIGTELDDVAKLLIKVKTTPLAESEIAYIRDVMPLFVKSLEEKSYSDSQVVIPSINNIEHWFNPDALNDLGHLYWLIINLNKANVRDFLLICMASIIKRVSNCDDVSPKPYVSNKIKKNPPAVSVTFNAIVNKYLEGMTDLSKIPVASTIVSGDATHINTLDNTVDLAITSPPYVNAFDYVRTLRLENIWLNMATEDELRLKKKLYFGTESISVKEEEKNISILDESILLNDCYYKILEVDKKRALILKRFFEDMKNNLIEVFRTLKKDSHYVIVIGNSNIRNVEVESWRIIKEIAEFNGYHYCSHIGYKIKNPYIRIPRGNKGGKIMYDHILVLQK